MKADSEKWKTSLFFGGLAVIALIINCAFMRHGSPQPASPGNQAAARKIADDTYDPVAARRADENAVETARKEAEAKEAATKHANYLAQYLNSGISRKPGAKMIALAVVSEDGKLNRALNDTIISRFKSDSVEIFPSVFRPQFVSDGLFSKTLAGSNDAIDKLELSKSLDMLLLGREEVKYSSDPSLQNVISANMRLEITAVSIATGGSQSWTFVANGAGFKETEARQMAEERLINQITRDTKMSLNH